MILDLGMSLDPKKKDFVKINRAKLTKKKIIT